jgi:epoxyqueuosine reductase
VGIAPNRLPEPEQPSDICPLAAGKGPERYDLTGVLPGCQAAVVVLFPYYQPPVEGANLSLYCQFPDYHGIIRQYLDRVAAWLGQHCAREPAGGHCGYVGAGRTAAGRRSGTGL